MVPATAIGSILDVTHLAGGAILQGANGVNQPNVSPTTQAAFGLVSTLIVGALMLAVAPNYVDGIVEDILDEPVACFAWGILALIVFIGAVVLLAITIIGIILVIPLVLVFVVLGIVGNVLAFVAVCDGFVDNRWIALVVAAIVTAVVNLIPIIGSIVSFVIGSIGIGAVARRWVEPRR